MLRFDPKLNSVAEAKYFDKLHALYSDPIVTIDVNLGGGGQWSKCITTNISLLKKFVLTSEL